MKHADELRALIGRAPVIKRDASGRVRWTPSLRAAVRDLIAAGCTEGDMARMLKVSRHAIREAVFRYGLSSIPDDYLTVSEIAERWGVKPTSVQQLKRRKGVQFRVWSGQYILPISEVEDLERHRAPLHTTRPPGYLTANEVQARWNMTTTSINKRLKGVPYVLLKQASGHTCRLYDAAGVHERFPVGIPLSCPRGYIPVKRLAGMLDITTKMVHLWFESGCPSLSGKNRIRYVNPELVAQWLLARRDPRTNNRGKQLAALLEAREVA